MKKYIDEKTFVTVMLCLVTWFFLKALLTKEFIQDGELSVHIGTKGTGFAKVS